MSVDHDLGPSTLKSRLFRSSTNVHRKNNKSHNTWESPPTIEPLPPPNGLGDYTYIPETRREKVKRHTSMTTGHLTTGNGLFRSHSTNKFKMFKGGEPDTEAGPTIYHHSRSTLT